MEKLQVKLGSVPSKKNFGQLQGEKNLNVHAFMEQTFSIWNKTAKSRRKLFKYTTFTVDPAVN